MVGEVGTVVGTIMVVVGASDPPLVSASDLAYSGPRSPRLPTTVTLTPTVTRILMDLRISMGMLPRPLMVMATPPIKGSCFSRWASFATDLNAHRSPPAGR